ncbi:alpha/beta hydrolase family protein [Bacteroidota bacterium]
MKHRPLVRICNIQIDPGNNPNLLVDLVFVRNRKKKPIVIFAHGFKSFKDWGHFNLISDYFARQGFVFVKFNFSQNGTTYLEPDKITESDLFGRNTIEVELNDIKQVINYCTETCLELKEESDPSELYLIGHSRGGSVTILYAHEDIRVTKLVTWAAFNDFGETWGRFYDLADWEKTGVNFRENRLTGEPLPLYYEVYENYLSNKSRFNIRTAVEQMRIPMLAIHGVEDEFIPYEESLELKKWNKQIEFSLHPYASHTFGGIHPYKKNTLPDDSQIVCDETIAFLRG